VKGFPLPRSRKALALTALSLLLLLLLYPVQLLHKYYLTPCAAAGPIQQTDFEMYLEPVDLTQYEQTLRRHPEQFTISQLAQIEFEERAYPIYQIDWNPTADRRLLIVAATHGNEFASALVIPDLLSEMGSLSLFSDWSIRIITPANPVGLAYQSRYNEDGCDINRDFKEFRTRGAQIQRDVVEDYQPDLIVSLHEGPQSGFFAITTQSVPKPFRQSLHRALVNNDIALAQNSFLGLPLAAEGIFYEGNIISTAKRLLGIHTLGRYAESQEIPVITTESSWKDTDLSTRIKPHRVTIQTVVESWPD